jgi:hypothetical protein
VVLVFLSNLVSLFNSIRAMLVILSSSMPIHSTIRTFILSFTCSQILLPKYCYDLFPHFT